MSKSLFQQYEAKRKMFLPGTILKNIDGSLSVCEIRILEVDEVYDNVKIEILKTVEPSGFRIGETMVIQKGTIKCYFEFEESLNV